jgi:glucose/arabinose dehydrogenase
MQGRIAALLSAPVVAAGVFGATALAAGAPPPPKAANGATVQQVAAGLKTPTSLAFGDGVVFEGDGGNSKSGPPNGGVYVLKGGTATKLAGSPAFVGGVLFHAGTLYVSGGTPTGPKSATWQILAWSGWNGTKFAKQKVVYTAPKGFQGFNGLGFAGGRLYVGVDVGLLNGNDHGPATLSPYLYDILTIKPNGKGFKVFAKGIRQPWQMVFPAGSTSPLVSDLGQDKAATNPPDFVLRVKAGDNFGFPTCNHTAGSNCSGSATPFQMFPPHTNIMGMVIIGKTLYMTSFLSTTGKGPGGEVVSMPLSGGKLTPVVTGFVAPTVGLGGSGGYLYIGELTGQVFRVKV